MPSNLRFYLVDAFAERAYHGNPAGVVLEADGLSDEQMQRIAAEVHVSETAFISRLSDLHRPALVRWFTPQAEVGFCGHATLAAAHTLQQAGHLPGFLTRPDATLALDSAAGELRLRPESLPEPFDTPLWWLSMPEPGLKPDNTNPMRTCELLGITVDDLEPALPPMRSRDDDLIYFVQTWSLLMDMKPRFDELADWSQRTGIRGFCVATTNTLTPAVNVHSRFFAPSVGINEDPVTGSVHGPLATYLVINGLVGDAGGRSALLCAQGRPGGRGGLVRALVHATGRGYQVSIGGQCFTTVTGEIRVPD